MKFDIVTFGSAVTDTFVNTELGAKGNFFHYKVGSKILINDLRVDIGGGGTNTAVAFARLGLKTGCITKVGKDSNGKEILKLLKKEKIKFLGNIGNKKTGYSVILDSKNKGRTILTYKGESNNIYDKDIKKFKTRWLYYSSLLGASFETQKRLAQKMHKKGTKIAFNPSEYHIKNKDLSSLLKITSILILNKEEAKLLAKKNRKKGPLLKVINSLGPKIVVITDKDRIIQAFDGKNKFELKPNKIKVIERTGAGDAFASGFVAGIIAGKSVIKSLELGLLEGESVIRYFGAKNKLIKRNIKK